MQLGSLQITTMKHFTSRLVIALSVSIAISVFWLTSNSCAATESPVYQVIRTDGKVEIRDYPALTIATTPMEDANINSGFGQLFKFISGSNTGAEKIAMTSPVLIDPTMHKKTMSFIMPKATVEKGVPKPTSETVQLGKVEPARYVVLRFDGGRSAQNESKAITDVQAWLEAQNFKGKSEPIFAYYDPPWTPTFLRRNEVMIRIEVKAGNP